MKIIINSNHFNFKFYNSKIMPRQSINIIKNTSKTSSTPRTSKTSSTPRTSKTSSTSNSQKNIKFK